MTPAQRRAIQELYYCIDSCQAAIGDLLVANYALPAHTADFTALIALLGAIIALCNALVYQITIEVPGWVPDVMQSVSLPFGYSGSELTVFVS